MKDWREEFITDEEVNDIMQLPEDEFMDYMGDLIEFYRNDPISGVYDILGLALTDYQKIIFEESWKSNNIFLCQSRGAGKSFLVSIFAALWSILYPNETIIMLGKLLLLSVMAVEKSL